MTTNPWAAVNSGAWASQVDEEEAAGTLGNPLAAPEEAFPDLAVAATKKQSKRDKGKKQTVSLAEFQTGKKAAYAPPTRGRTAAKEEIVLPSGPRERDDDDDGNSRGGLGGAFAGRDYKDKGKLSGDMSSLRLNVLFMRRVCCLQSADSGTGMMMIALHLDAKTMVPPELILQTVGVERRSFSQVETQALAAGIHQAFH